MRLPIRRQSPDRAAAVSDDFDRLREGLYRQLDRWPDFLDPLPSVRDVLPLADIEESDDAYVVDVELPGVKREDLSVEATHGRLTVTGERRERERVGLLRHRSRTTGRFRFEVVLPVEIDEERISASLEHGLLHLVVPKAERARRRRIAITTGR